MNDDISFSNMDNYRGNSSGKFGLTFKQIVLMHINRCVQNGSVEWHGGYWQEKQQQSWTDKIYVPNSREVYCNSVKILRALLLGYFDDKIKAEDIKLKKEFDDTYAKLVEEERKTDKSVKSEWNTFKVEWHIKLFESLIMLSKRLNFFEEESSEDEID